MHIEMESTLKTRYSLIALGALLALSQAAFAQRGSSGHVNVIYWQAPSILNPYLSGGTKDLESSSLILDPLIKFNQVGEMIPALAESVPTVANGVKCVVVNAELRNAEPMAWDFAINFAKDNNLQMAEACLLPDPPIR